MSYQSILSRSMSVNYVNPGFGGAGKTEPEVVAEVNAVKACCYVFDLGKSYGMQSPAPYASMLQSIRASHPGTPIVCITPIFSVKEYFCTNYVQLSDHTSKVVYQAYGEVDNVHIVDGLNLLGPDDPYAFSTDGVHPSELGYRLIAERLLPLVKQTDFSGPLNQEVIVS